MTHSWIGKTHLTDCIHNDGIGEVEAGVELLRELSRFLTIIDVACEYIDYYEMDLSAMKTNGDGYSDIMNPISHATEKSVEFVEHIDLIRSNISKSIEELELALTMAKIINKGPVTMKFAGLIKSDKDDC